MLIFALFMTKSIYYVNKYYGWFCSIKHGRKSKVFLQWGLPLSSTNWHVSKGGGVHSVKSESDWKRKEFFVVLFCDLEGLLQQFVAAAWKIMHWKFGCHAHRAWPCLEFVKSFFSLLHFVVNGVEPGPPFHWEKCKIIGFWGSQPFSTHL